jgi:hypothetical protein
LLLTPDRRQAELRRSRSVQAASVREDRERERLAQLEMAAHRRDRIKSQACTHARAQAGQI